jgi:hypothetical protein
MQSALVIDQFCNPAGLPQYLKDQVKFKPGKTGDGKPTAIPYLPKGTIFEADQALLRCKTKQAQPIDQECFDALGWSDAQIAAAKVDYEMNVLGINNKEDRELFKAGVILGYNKDQSYKKGPAWDAYQEAMAAAAEVDDEEELIEEESEDADE